MAEQAATRRMPPLPGLIAGGLVIMGLMLSTFVAEGFLIVAGLGAFGPGILRELGWLRDQDEFQRQAAHRAGYHAYLIGGLATVLIIAAVRWNGRDVEVSSEWLVLVLVIMWLTWLFSALLAYWGAQKTASRVLMVFGSWTDGLERALPIGGTARGLHVRGALLRTGLHRRPLAPPDRRVAPCRGRGFPGDNRAGRCFPQFVEHTGHGCAVDRAVVRFRHCAAS